MQCVEQMTVHVPRAVHVTTEDVLGSKWIEEVKTRSHRVDLSTSSAMSTQPPMSKESLHQLQRADDVIGCVWKYWETRASIGGGRGDAPPHFSGWGDSIGIVPPFLV